jgi:hypothetical protein
MIVSLRWTLLTLLTLLLGTSGIYIFWIPLVCGLKKNKSHSIVKPPRRMNLELEKRLESIWTSVDGGACRVSEQG